MKYAIPICQSDGMISSPVQRSQISLHHGSWGYFLSIGTTERDVIASVRHRFEREEKDGEEKPFQFLVTIAAISNELVVKQEATVAQFNLLRHTISTRASMCSLQEGRSARPGFLQIYLGRMRLFTSVVSWSPGLPVEKCKYPLHLWQLGVILLLCIV